MAAAESIERLERDNEQLKYLLREERLTTDWLNDQLDGANYEIHQRELRLKEKDLYIEQLLQQIQELKKQATADVQPAMASASPPEVPSFVKTQSAPGGVGGRSRAARRVTKRRCVRCHVKSIITNRCRCIQPMPRGKPICSQCKDRLLRPAATQTDRRRSDPAAQARRRAITRKAATARGAGGGPRARAPEQPPAASVPHGQLGINALTTGVILRVRHRLPFRMIAQLLNDMAGLRVSPGGLGQTAQTHRPLAGRQVQRT